MAKIQTNKKMSSGEIFATNLRGLMAMRGVSPTEMQEYMGISATTFYKRLRRPSEFTMSNVESASKKLGVPAGALIANVMEVVMVAG